MPEIVYLVIWLGVLSVGSLLGDNITAPHAVMGVETESFDIQANLLHGDAALLDDDAELDVDFQMLISGGYRPAQHTLTKYVVSIRTKRAMEFFGDNHYCAGTIIDPRLILTAAHCVVGIKRVITQPRQIIVVAGAPNRLRRDNSTMQFNVNAVIPHPKFKRGASHDLAILRLADPLPHNKDQMKIIKLAAYPPPFGTNCTTLGWGRLFQNGPIAAEAVYVDLPIVKHTVCANKYPNSYDRGMICAHDVNDLERGPCSGDSGGPLICHSKLVGTISWGTQCSLGYPTIFTDVTYFRKWIEAVKRRSNY